MVGELSANEMLSVEMAHLGATFFNLSTLSHPSHLALQPPHPPLFSLLPNHALASLHRGYCSEQRLPFTMAQTKPE
jgi:hypothetical protein